MSDNEKLARGEIPAHLAYGNPRAPTRKELEAALAELSAATDVWFANKKPRGPAIQLRLAKARNVARRLVRPTVGAADA